MSRKDDEIRMKMLKEAIKLYQARSLSSEIFRYLTFASSEQVVEIRILEDNVSDIDLRMVRTLIVKIAGLIITGKSERDLVAKHDGSYSPKSEKAKSDILKLFEVGEKFMEDYPLAS